MDKKKKKNISQVCLTWPAVALLHPDVAVVLGDARLRVQEGHPDAALGAEAGVVAAAVFDGLPVELVAEPEGGAGRSINRIRSIDSGMGQREKTLVKIRAPSSASVGFRFPCSESYLLKVPRAEG